MRTNWRFAFLGISQRRLELAAGQLERVRIEVIQIIRALRYVVYVLEGEQVVVQIQVCVDGVLGRYPVDGALDLATVDRHAVTGLEVCGAADLDDLAVVILDDLVALDDIRAIRRTSPSGLRRWNFGGGTSAKSLFFSIYSSRVNGTLRVPASSLRGLFGTSNSSH